MDSEFFDFATRKVKQVAVLGRIAIDTQGQGISVSPDRRQILYASRAARRIALRRSRENAVSTLFLEKCVATSRFTVSEFH
jgi:hypothetical protein